MVSKLRILINEIDDQVLQKRIEEFIFSLNSDLEKQMAITTFALQILQSNYASDKGEWDMIAKKAKKWLKGNQMMMPEELNLIKN